MLILSALTGRGERHVVPATMAENPQFRLASQFLDRYAALLDTASTEDARMSLRRIKDDGFRYAKGSDAVLRNLTGNEDFSLRFDGKKYFAEWRKGSDTILSCSFPAQIDMLTFSNKNELELRLIEALQRPDTADCKPNLPLRDKSLLTPISYSDYYIEDKGYYVTPRLKHQLVFEPLAAPPDSCRLLIEGARYQLESLSNMMLSGFSTNPQHFELKVCRGYKSATVASSLSSLFNVLSEEGSIPYWGVDTYDGQTVKGVWVWINGAGSYAHMLSVTIPIRAVDESTTADAKLYCYLRLDNLKSMFEEYQ